MGILVGRIYQNGPLIPAFQRSVFDMLDKSIGQQPQVVVILHEGVGRTDYTCEGNREKDLEEVDHDIEEDRYR